jgi:hypothetical protein
MSTNNNDNANTVPNNLDVVDGALSELKNQYNNLVEDIKKKHEEQQNIFKEIASSDYDGEDYNKNRINHLIEANVQNLKEQRDNIWKYLTNVYNKNTQQTYRNFRTLKRNEKQINMNGKRKNELSNKLGDLKSENNTQQKLIQHNLYKHKEVHNKSYIQFVIMIALIICILMIYATTNDMVDSTIGWGTVAVIGVITVLYYVYRMYIYRMNRDKFHWHKIYFNKIDESQLSLKDDNNDNNEELDYAKLDESAKKLFKSENKTCKGN